MKLSL